MRSVPISHSITGPLARSIGLGCTGAEREKALTNAGGLSGPPLGVHYSDRRLLNPVSLSRLDREILSPETGDVLDLRDRSLLKPDGATDIIPRGLIEPVWCFVPIQDGSQGLLDDRQVPTLDVPHYTPFHGLVLVLLSLDLQQQGLESLFAVLGGVVQVILHFTDRTARQLKVSLFALLIT